MRTPESTIKAAILHPEREIRCDALRYFTDAHSEDESVMPLVIEAVEKYGRGGTFYFLKDAAQLRQTEATLDWLINELRREYDLTDVEQDNHRFALAGIIEKAPQLLLMNRLPNILRAPSVPEQIVQPLRERLDMFSWDWNRGWSALKYFGQDTMRRKMITWWHDRKYAVRIVEALARHRTTRAETVLRLLEGDYGGEDLALMDWLRPRFMDLTGEMRLDQAVPLLVDVLDGNFVSEDEHPETSDRALFALAWMDPDRVIHEIDDRWWDADELFRLSAADVLSSLRGDLCAERSIAFFRAEEDYQIQMFLANALLRNFVVDAIEWLWRFASEADDSDLKTEEVELRWHLANACTIMGRTFPRFNEWREDAQRDACLRTGSKRERVADEINRDQTGPEQPGNGKK